LNYLNRMTMHGLANVRIYGKAFAVCVCQSSA